MTDVVNEIQVEAPVESETLVIDSLESLIIENLNKIESLIDERKKTTEMIDSYLGNDEVYKAYEEEAKKASKIKAGTKSEILKRPEVAHLAAEEKEIKSEIKEIKESMNSYLGEYKRLSGTDIIEKDGKQIKIKTVYGLQGRLF